LSVDVFGVCAEGYAEEPKGRDNKSLVVQALQNWRLAPTNSSTHQWNAKNLSLPYSVRYPTIISITYQRRRYNILATKMLLHC
jgi:hypothetical protein